MKKIKYFFGAIGVILLIFIPIISKIGTVAVKLQFTKIVKIYIYLAAVFVIYEILHFVLKQHKNKN